MYCIGYDDIFPIFEAVVIKIFNPERIFDRKDLILSIFDKVLSAPYFNGIGKFDEYIYYTMDGRRSNARLTESSWLKIKDRIANAELKSVGLNINQEDPISMKDKSIPFRFAKKATEEFGMNSLSAYIPEDNYRRNINFSLFDYFVELCELSKACYGFASVHVGSTDSQAVTDCYKNTIEVLPVDCINSNRYITGSDKLIKDVCWLNFISNNHLQQLEGNIEPLLSDLPFYKKNDRGVYFAVADDPYMGEESYERLRCLRDIFKPIICEENWYRF